jgi:ribosomal protein S18 acetylase RimI-like enzyme
VDSVFRQAERNEVPDIVRLLRNDALGCFREQHEGAIEAPYYQAFDAISVDDRQLLVVAEQVGVIVGTLQLSFIPSMTFKGGERAQIEAVRVDGARRGSGIGRQMIEWAIEQAAERGCHMVQLTTNKQRPEALRFYESLGFEATHEGMKLHL